MAALAECRESWAVLDRPAEPEIAGEDESRSGYSCSVDGCQTHSHPATRPTKKAALICYSRSGLSFGGGHEG